MESSATCGVYEFWCGPYFYQGSSKNMEGRLKTHRKALTKGKHGNDKMQRAFDKYGMQDERFLVVCAENLRTQYEQDYIFANFGDEFYLNLSPSSEAPVWTPESRAKLSATLKGRPAPNKGKPASDEAKAKMAEAHRLRWAEGRGHSEEALAKMSAAAMGNTRTLGRKCTPEEIAKTVAVHTGAKRSPETRARMAEAQRKRWARARGEE